MNRRTILSVAPFLSGCGYVDYMRRPIHIGFKRKPAWHNREYRCLQAPVIQQGRVFIAGQPMREMGTRPVALDLSTGRILWIAKRPANSIRLIAGDYLFPEPSHGPAEVLSAGTGEVIGRAPSFQHATLHNGVLYTASDKSLDARSAKPPFPGAWSVETTRRAAGAPLVSETQLFLPTGPAEDIITKIPTALSLEVFQAQSGTPSWKWLVPTYKHDLAGIAVDSSAVYILVRERADNLRGPAYIAALDRAQGKEIWRVPLTQWAKWRGAPYLAGKEEIIVGDQLKEGAGHTVRGLDRATGKQRWECTLDWAYNNVAFSDGRLFATESRRNQWFTKGRDENPQSWLVGMDIRSGRQLWESETVSLSEFTPPGAGEGRVVVGANAYKNTSREAGPEAEGIRAYDAA